MNTVLVVSMAVAAACLCLTAVMYARARRRARNELHLLGVTSLQAALDLHRSASVAESHHPASVTETQVQECAQQLVGLLGLHEKIAREAQHPGEVPSTGYLQKSDIIRLGPGLKMLTDKGVIRDSVNAKVSVVNIERLFELFPGLLDGGSLLPIVRH